MLPLIDVTTALGDIFREFSYVAPFVVQRRCGVGLPLPEEVTLVLSGVLLYRGEVEFVPIVLVCSTAILLGDSVPFFLGRKYGMSDGSYYNWKAKYAGLTVSELKRLKALEEENRRLKQIVAEQALDNRALKELLSKNF